MEGPLLLAVNHPNSFVDAVLLGVIMEKPVHFIARGDVFEKPAIARLLEQLNMIPIFRIRDGKDKLSLNDMTFIKSEAILREHKLLLIFVEGFCAHQTTLQLPLKKGAPRIVHDCWQQQIPVKVLPVWLQYSSFTRIGKTIDIRLGSAFGQEIIKDTDTAPQAHYTINEVTAQALQKLQADTTFVHQRPAGWRYYAFMLPALAGALLHALLYLPVCLIARRLNGSNVHYDGLVFGFLMVLYPLYLLTAALMVAWAAGGMIWGLLAAVVMVLLARCFIVWKK